MVHHHHRIAPAIALALALALAASVAPVAWADPQPLATAEATTAATQSPASPATRPNPDEQTATGATTYTALCSEVCSGGGYGAPTAPSTVARVVAPTDSFHWDDAGIGAGTAVVLTVLLAGGVLGAAKVRRRATPSSARPTT